MTDKAKLINFDRKEWNSFLKDIEQETFDHTVPQGLLAKINSPSYWIDAARTTGYASEQTFLTFEKWIHMIEEGEIDTPIKKKSRPEIIAELSAASSMEMFKASQDFFESIILSGNANFIESACLEYCRRLVRNGDFENAIDVTMRVDEVGGQWSEKFSPYFERIPFWSLLASEQFGEAFAMRTTLAAETEFPRLVRFEFIDPVEDEFEYVIYEIAISGKLDPNYPALLSRLLKVLSRRGASEKVAEVKQALALERGESVEVSPTPEVESTPPPELD